MNVFAVTLDVDHVLARYDWKVVDGEYTVVYLLLDDISLSGSFNRHLSVRCSDNNDIGIRLLCLYSFVHCRSTPVNESALLA